MVEPFEQADKAGTNGAVLRAWLAGVLKSALLEDPMQGSQTRRQVVGDGFGWWCNVLSMPVLVWGIVYALLPDSGYMGSVFKAAAGLVFVVPPSGACLILGVTSLLLTRGRTRRSTTVFVLSFVHLILLGWTIWYVTWNA